MVNTRKFDQITWQRQVIKEEFLESSAQKPNWKWNEREERLLNNQKQK